MHNQFVPSELETPLGAGWFPKELAIIEAYPKITRKFIKNQKFSQNLANLTYPGPRAGICTSQAERVSVEAKNIAWLTAERT
jgi:hypothetical protein